MSNISFYNDLDFKYPEVAILLQRINRLGTRIGKFYIPILLPMVSGISPKNNNKPKPQSTNQMVSTSAMTNYTESNYIELKIPKYMFPMPMPPTGSCDRKCIHPGDSCDGHTNDCAFLDKYLWKDTWFEKGQKFIITFIGGDINNIAIMGVIENE